MHVRRACTVNFLCEIYVDITEPSQQFSVFSTLETPGELDLGWRGGGRGGVAGVGGEEVGEGFE